MHSRKPAADSRSIRGNRSDRSQKRVAIVGGGPGGLLSAYFIGECCGEACSVTVFEADARLGGKVSTKSFSSAPVKYEAGVAELYDYSHFGPDPLRQLVKDFGLSTVEMAGSTILLGDQLIRDERDVARSLGTRGVKELREFQSRCRKLYSPEDYYEEYVDRDNAHEWAGRSFRQVLDEISNPAVRKLIEIAVRSDVATEPHLTNGLNGLKNVLMDDPSYHRLYRIEGGIECLIDELRKRIKADIRLATRVVRVGRRRDNRIRITTRDALGEQHQEIFDTVVVALPNYWLAGIEFEDERLRASIQRHLARYDQPAHYLRVTLLFAQAFWRSRVSGSYFLSDAFGGCCLYDENVRQSSDLPAALGWLLAGNDALALSNLDDERLTRLALESLPQPLRPNRRTLLESRVHRWVGTVNGLPGGNPVTDMRSRHCPDPNARPCVYLVGDYMFDSTLNGVCDSASYVAELLMTRLRTEKYRPDLRTDGGAPPPARRRRPRLHRSYFQYYDGEKSYERSFGEYFSAEEVEDLIAAVWGCRPPYRLLDCGSASGLTLKAFHRQGIEAWGIENNSYIHQRTPRAWKSRNLFGDVRRLPFPDQFFDFAHDTCLCYLAEDDLDSALSELFRVSRVGVIFGSISADVPAELIEETEMFYGMHSLHTLWQWSEKFIASGFRLAVSDPVTLEKAWDVTLRYAEDGPVWYPDKESFRYCFYSKPEVPRFLAGRAGARR